MNRTGKRRVGGTKPLSSPHNSGGLVGLRESTTHQCSQTKVSIKREEIHDWKGRSDNEGG